MIWMPLAPLARHGDAMVPSAGMEGRPGETFAALDLGEDRRMQKTGGTNEHIGNLGLTVGGLDMPEVIGKPSLGNLGVEADIFAQIPVVGHLFDIGLNFRRRRIGARPIVVGLKWKFILARQNINKQTGIGVVPPGTADLIGFFIDREIDTGFFQFLRHEKPGDAGTGDDNAKRIISHTICPHSVALHQAIANLPIFWPIWPPKSEISYRI